MGRAAIKVSLILLVLALCLAPVAVFVVQASAQSLSGAWADAFTSSGLGSLTRTFKLMLAAGTLGTAYGWLVGTWLSLQGGLQRRLSLALLTVPVICPPFLWAVGVQGWKGFVPFGMQMWFDGFSGHVIASTIPIAALAASVCATRAEWLSPAAIESVLLARGPRWLFWLRLRACWQGAVGAGMLGALMAAGDAGTGQMMGFQGLAGVIHSAFVTEHDFSKAASRALVTLLILAPVGLLAALALTRPLMARRLAVNALPGDSAARGGGFWLVMLAALPLLTGVTGLLRPLWGGTSSTAPAFRDATLTLQESLRPTCLLFLAVVAILVLTLIPLGRWMAGRRWVWALLLGTGVMLLAIPQSVHGLGWLMLRGWLPLPWETGRSLDVGLALSARWMLVGAHLMALSWRSLPASALDATRLFTGSWISRVLVLSRPVLVQAALPVAVCLALVSLGDASSVVLLQAPGWATYATRLFSIMDNAPEKQVAAMCLVYLGLPLLLVLAWQLTVFFKSPRS
ncbi:MAG: hypothetical protein V4662_23540 [Verrucomicrobiota bacterium]